MSHRESRETLSEFETAFAGLTPSPSAIDRDRLMYLAGQAAAERQATRSRGLWRGVSAVLATTVAALATLVASDRNMQAVHFEADAPVVVQVNPTPKAAVRPAAQANVALRVALIEDVWPAEVHASGGSQAGEAIRFQRAWLGELLESESSKSPRL